MQQQMQKGHLKEGKIVETLTIYYSSFLSGTANFQIFERDVIYKGFVDSEGKAFGCGTATDLDDPNYVYTGTFKNDESLTGIRKPNHKSNRAF